MRVIQNMISIATPGAMEECTIPEAPSWLGWVGHMNTPREFLIEKDWVSGWVIAKAVNAIFRSIGVVAFANSPITGVIIFAAIVLENREVAVASILCPLVALITAKILKAPDRQICDGITLFNSILLGCVLVAVIPPVLGVEISMEIWVIIVISSSITVFVEQGIATMLSPAMLPGQSFPFNIVAAVLFLIIKYKYHIPDTSIVAVEKNMTETFDWAKGWEGVLLSTGQVYGVPTPASSVCIWLGFMAYSPMLTFLFFLGATIGTFMGAFFMPAAWPEVYFGLFGYNSMLTAGGTLFFTVPSTVGIACCITGAILASGFQIALLPLFNQNLVPVFSYPFVCAIMVILPIALREDGPVKFIGGPIFPEPSFPELHLFTYHKAVNERAVNSIGQGTYQLQRADDVEDPLQGHKTQ